MIGLPLPDHPRPDASPSPHQNPADGSGKETRDATPGELYGPALNRPVEKKSAPSRMSTVPDPAKFLEDALDHSHMLGKEFVWAT
jgi:hypothetical protein